MRSVLDVTEDNFEAEVLKVDTPLYVIVFCACEDQFKWPAGTSCRAVTLCVTMQADVPVLVDFWATW